DSATATVSTVSSVNVDPCAKRRMSWRFSPKNSYVEPMMSPTIAPSIETIMPPPPTCSAWDSPEDAPGRLSTASGPPSEGGPEPMRGRQKAGGSGWEGQRPLASPPPLHAPSLLDPGAHLGGVDLLDGLDLDVARVVALAERRRRVEAGAAEEHDIDRDVVGDQLDDPAAVGEAVVGLPPLDGVLEVLVGLANHLVDALHHRVQVRHDAPHPVINLGVAVGGLGRLAGRLAWCALAHLGSSSGTS